MKNSYKWSALSLVVLALIAGWWLLYSPAPPPVPENSSSSSSYSEPITDFIFSDDPRVLSALAWDETTLQIEIPKEDIVDPNPIPGRADKLWSFYSYGSNDTIVKGQLRGISLDIARGPAAAPFPVRYLQVFHAEGFVKEDVYIKLGDDILPPNQVEEYIVFKDEQYIVLDVTHLFIEEPFADFLARYEDNPDYDYTWILDGYEYCKENIKNIIVAR